MGRIDTSSVRDRVCDAIRTRVMQGVYKPGDRLREVHLAQEFGVSQTTVREALRELVAIHLLKAVPNRGTHVRVITRQEITETLVVRNALECQAILTLADRGVFHDPPSLREAARGSVHAAESRDHDAYAQHDAAFHRGVVEASQNAVLLRTWNDLGVLVRVRASIAITEHDPEELIQLARQHEPILDALADRDFDAAIDQLRAHGRMGAEIVGSRGRPDDTTAGPEGDHPAD